MSQDNDEGNSKTNVLEAVGTVGAKIGHDFNNLLAAIQGCAELMKFKLETLPNGNPCIRQIQLIESSIAKGVSLTNQMRGWLRSEPLPKQQVALAPLATSVGEFLRSSGVSSQAIEIVTLAEPYVAASEFHIRQALIALCANAFDAMHNLADRVLVLIVDEGDDFARISVIDHGVGISDEKRATLLQPLQSNKQHKIGEGLGVNLAMTDELMRRLGGELAIRSAPGIGSAFSLVFSKKV